MIIPTLLINCLSFTELEYSLQRSQLKALIRSIIDIKLFFFLGWRGMESTITEATTDLLRQLRLMKDDGDECGAIGAMIGKGKRCTRRKTFSTVTLSTTNPHNLTWARTRAAAVGSRRLTA
jgi:hypothetical protein